MSEKLNIFDDLKRFGSADLVKTNFRMPQALLARVDEIAEDMGVTRTRLYLYAIERFMRDWKQPV